MTEIKMRDEPPSEPGWYWARQAGVRKPEIVQLVRQPDKTRYVFRAGYDHPLSIRLFDAWSDRLPEPEEQDASLAGGVAVPVAPANPPPRYDEVFEEGVRWLDGLAGEPITDKEPEVKP